MLARDIEKAKFIVSHAYDYPTGEVALAILVLDLIDETGYEDDDFEPYEDTQKRITALESENGRLDNEVGRLMDLVDTLNDQADALSRYIDDISIAGAADDFKKQNALWSL